MAGTLLSGWRIRLFNSNGQPLYPGRVCFYDSTTSLPKAVFADRDLTVPLGDGAGKVNTDQDGYLPAIWFQGGLYKADVQSKIQEDPETWESLWTINDLGTATVATGGAGSGTLAYCASVGEMKGIVAGDVSAVICAGYYEPGDAGDPLFFVWNPSSTKTDDAGAFIRPNDTAVGTAGRYHQVFPTGVLDIRKWGGIPGSSNTDCTGALVHMGDYANNYEVYPSRPPTMGFVAPGNYYFSGSINFNRTWTNQLGNYTITIPYFIGEGVQFVGITTGISVTITNPTTIESNNILTKYPSSISFVKGSVEYIRPQWLTHYIGNLAARIEHACTFGIEVRVYGQEAAGAVVIENDTEWKGPPISFDTTNLQFTTSSTKLTIRSEISVKDNHYIFGLDSGTGSVYIYNQEVDARWFGWGSLSGTNQGPALRRAIYAAKDQATILASKLTTSGQVMNSAISGFNMYIQRLKIEGTMTLGSSGSLSQIYLDVPYNQYCLNVPSTSNVIKLLNPSISPHWFGAMPSDTGGSINTPALTKCLWAGARGRNVVDGGGGVFYINAVLYADFGNTVPNAIVHWKDITIEAGVDTYDVTNHPTMVGIHGGIDLNFEAVNVNTKLRTDVGAIFFNTYWSRVRNCFFGSDISYGEQCEDYAFVNNQQWGQKNGTVFASATKGAVISGNTFTDSAVYLYGDSGIQTGYDFPMLQHIHFTNNFVNNLDQAFMKGCLYLVSRAANTLVNGVIVKDNTFGGNIPAWHNNGENPDEFYQYRIHDVLISGGSWAIANKSSADVRHLMIIKDNSYDWYDPAEDDPAPGYPYNRKGHRSNFLPSTSGTFSTSEAIGSDMSGSNSIWYYSKQWKPDPDMIFQLTGDTTSILNIGCSLKGWRRSLGNNQYDSLKPCIGCVTITGNPNSTGSLMIELADKQWGATGGSKGYKYSFIYFNTEWSIYKRW